MQKYSPDEQDRQIEDCSNDAQTQTQTNTKTNTKTLHYLTRIYTSPNAAPVLEGEQRPYITHNG